MSDIFISYAREDRRKAQMLSKLFERRGWSVWWDRDIPIGGVFHDVIQRELKAAKCVVVLWSSDSVKSNFVLDEATEAAERGVMLPALIDDIRAPLGFGRFQTVNLARWNGKESHVDIGKLFAAVSDLVKSQEIEAKESAQALTDGGAAGHSGEPPRRVSERLYAHWKVSLIAMILVGCGLIWIVVKVVRPLENSSVVNSGEASPTVGVPTNSNDTSTLTNATPQPTVNVKDSRNSNSESTNKNVEPSPSITPTTVDTTTVIPGLTKERITSTVNKVVRDHLNQRGPINPTARLKEDLGADDLDIIEIKMRFEEYFRIDIYDDDLTKVKRVQDFYSLIEEKTRRGK